MVYSSPVSVFASVLILAALLCAAAGNAQEKARETLLPRLRVGDDQAYIQLYGQIDKGILIYDDGHSTLGYPGVDNANSSTRAGLTLYGALENEWSVGGNIEAQWTPYSTSNVNQLNRSDVDWDEFLLRKAEIYIDSSKLGRIWLGQGSMASDSTSELDLSGTSVVGYSSVADSAGGQLFRFPDGTLSRVSVGRVFSNFDGLGRKLRVRYDTPSFAGFSFGASVGTQVVPEETDVTVWDLAAKYHNTFTDYEVAAGLAYSRPGDGQNRLNGSVSVLHAPSGVSLTLAAAHSDNGATDPYYGYIKLGYQTDIFDAGKTAFSVDTYYGESIDAEHSRSRSVGAQLVQSLDYLQTELYFGVRLYSYDEKSFNFEGGTAVLVGARAKF